MMVFVMLIVILKVIQSLLHLKKNEKKQYNCFVLFCLHENMPRYEFKHVPDKHMLEHAPGRMRSRVVHRNYLC